MSAQLTKPLNNLKKAYMLFDDENNKKKVELIQQLSKIRLAKSKALLHYFDVLQFICAYPPNEKTLLLAEKELSRLTKFCQTNKNLDDDFFLNSGLPFSEILMGFSHDCIHWFLKHSHFKVSLDRYENPKFDLNDALKLTLPSLEMSETAIGMENDELLESLLVPEKNHLPFLIEQFDKFNEMPFLKDFLFEGLDIYVNLKPTNKAFSKAYNRLQQQEHFYHTEMLKKFDHVTLLNTSLPEPKKLSDRELNEAIDVVKNSMALTLRETDPITYMDPASFRLYELERGISIAIYGMVSNRQLPLESYVGYTLFKNGFQAAYGGGWVFGQRSLFGINITESLRGGESGYILIQLLRVYRQVFNVNYFEVEPYQYGLDNPEGIQSGAFWFYYRYGFRPLDKKLNAIAFAEHQKIISKKGYRTSSKTLEQFTESNIGMNLGKEVPMTAADIMKKVKNMIATKYQGNRTLAIQKCVANFNHKTEKLIYLNTAEKHVLEEVALVAESLNLTNPVKLNILSKMIRVKPADLYEYQSLLLAFLK